MKENVLISVVVPVYNVEKYLEKCIKSILTQVYTNFELILVDDGSLDQSGKICDEYEKKDSRIVVIHQENGGLSAARNAGTLVAKGEFITYIDSDDYVCSDYLMILADAVVSNEADMACANYSETSELSEDIFSVKDVKQYEVSVLDGETACRRMLETTDSFSLVVAWGKLIRTHIAKDNLFPVGRVHEDNATTFKFYLASACVVITDKPIYAYFIRDDGIQRGLRNSKRIDDELFSVCSRAQWLEGRGFYHLASISWNIVFERLREVVLENVSDRNKWKTYYDALMHSAIRQMKLKCKTFLLVRFPVVFLVYRKCFLVSGEK